MFFGGRSRVGVGVKKGGQNGLDGCLVARCQEALEVYYHITQVDSLLEGVLVHLPEITGVALAVVVALAVAIVSAVSRRAYDVNTGGARGEKG